MTDSQASPVCLVCGEPRGADAPCPVCGDEPALGVDREDRGRDRIEDVQTQTYFDAELDIPSNGPPAPTPGLPPTSGAETDPIRFEVATWLQDAHLRRVWAVPRARLALSCVALAIVIPVLTLLSLAVRGRGDLLGLTLLVVLLIFGPILVDLGLCAIFGGALEATPEGLDFRFNVRGHELFPWALIASVGVDDRVYQQGRYRRLDKWLVIRFKAGDRSWPLSLGLWGSTPDCLRVSPFILPGSTEIVATEIAAAVAAALGPTADPPDQGPDPGPRSPWGGP